MMKYSNVIDNAEEYKLVLQGVDWWPVVYDDSKVRKLKKQGYDVPND